MVMTKADVQAMERKLDKCYSGEMSVAEVADFATTALARALDEVKRLQAQVANAHQVVQRAA